MNRTKTLAARLTLLLGLAAAGLAAAADYAREKKWADEILPGLVVGDAVWLEAEGRSFLALETVVAKPRGRLVLVHGIGVHPDWNLIGTLRTALADAGYSTLSIQMPVLAADAKAEDYPPTLPEAAARIHAAVLRLGGGAPIAIVAHSLGARMANEYFVRHPGTPVAAYVALGASAPLPSLPPSLAVLDAHGSGDLPPVLKAAAERAKALEGRARSRQLVVEGADHFYAGSEGLLVTAIDAFLRESLVR